MNILEKRKVKPEIYDIVKNLTFGNYKLKLAGFNCITTLSQRL